MLSFSFETVQKTTSYRVHQDSFEKHDVQFACKWIPYKNLLYSHTKAALQLLKVGMAVEFSF